MAQIKTKFIENSAIDSNKLATNSVTDVKVATGISATKLADGSVNNTEFQYLDGVTSSIQTQLNDKISSSEKGANNGVATLDSGGKVPVSQLPNSIMEFQGQWNASTNSPTLADGVGNAGDVYRVSTAGSQDLGSGSISFSVGDWVMYSGTVWQKASNSNDVTSVNSQTGAVVLDSDDISEGATNLYFTNERAQDAIGDNLLDTASVNLTYNDGTGQISADVLPAGVDHDSLQNFVANEHIDHSSVSIATSGTSGLSGGGDITTTRNISVQPNNATSAAPASGDFVLFSDISDSNNLKKATAQQIADLSSVSGRESFTLSAGDITNQYVDLAQLIKANSDFLFVRGGGLMESGVDYTLSTEGGITRVTFAGSLATAGASALVAGDVLQISYRY